MHHRHNPWYQYMYQGWHVYSLAFCVILSVSLGAWRVLQTGESGVVYDSWRRSIATKAALYINRDDGGGGGGGGGGSGGGGGGGARDGGGSEYSRVDGIPSILAEMESRYMEAEALKQSLR